MVQVLGFTFGLDGLDYSGIWILSVWAQVSKVLAYMVSSLRHRTKLLADPSRPETL